MADAQGNKTGGRVAGTPNKATREVKDFLGRVFERAFADKRFEDKLVEQIVGLTLDTKLLVALLAHYAGSPSKQVDVNLKGRVTLAQLVAGTAKDVDVDEGEASS